MKKMILFLVLVFLAIGCTQNVQNVDSTSTPIKQNNVVTGNVIAHVTDVPANSIYEFKYNGEPAILVNIDGEYMAYMNKCTHQGAQFTKDSMINGKIQCPLHGATFNPTDGNYSGHANGKNFGLAGLTPINVKVEGDNILSN
jgi:nitrite reductase/ring-hydroxylating ferredoxin subunit